MKIYTEKINQVFLTPIKSKVTGLGCPLKIFLKKHVLSAAVKVPSSTNWGYVIAVRTGSTFETATTIRINTTPNRWTFAILRIATANWWACSPYKAFYRTRHEFFLNQPKFVFPKTATNRSKRVLLLKWHIQKPIQPPAPEESALHLRLSSVWEKGVMQNLPP